MAEEKKEEQKEKKYVYGSGVQSHLSRAFRGIFPGTWLQSEYGERVEEEKPESPQRKS